MPPALEQESNLVKILCLPLDYLDSQTGRQSDREVRV
jgi:hypothetical protein